MQPLIIAIELDGPVQKLWDKVKGKWAGSTGEFLQKNKPGLEIQDNFSFQFLMIAIDRAHKAGITDPKAFKLEVEMELKLFFPDLKPAIPHCVKNLTFLMHAAVYGRSCCPREGLSLLDEFLDLKADHLKEILLTPKYIGSYQKLFHGNRKDIEELSKLSEPAFNEFKWNLLHKILSLPTNSVCQFPGLEIIDLILESFGLEIASILSAVPLLATKLEPLDKPLPSCVQSLVEQLILKPAGPLEYMDCIKSIDVTSTQDETILAYMAKICGSLEEKCGERDIISFCQNQLNFELTIGLEQCQKFIFTDLILNIVKGLYPNHPACGSLPLFMNSALVQAICEGKQLTCEKIWDSVDRIFLVPLLFNNPNISTGQLDKLFSNILDVDESDRKTILLSEITKLITKSAADSMPTGNQAIFSNLAGPALMLRRYRFQALNHLMYREMHFMDPVISDTLCELRPPFLMDCDVIIQTELTLILEELNLIEVELRKGKDWKSLVALYNRNYLAIELNETLISSPLQLIGNGPDPYDYLILCERLETALQKKGKEYYPRHLGLCKALTRSSFLIRDQLGIETGEATISNMPGNELRRRRAEMGTYNIWYTKFAAESLLRSPIIKCPAFEETAKVLINCNVITNDSKFCIPVVPIYQAQTLAMLKTFELGLPIILRLKRIHITSSNGLPETCFQFQGNTPVEEIIANAEYIVAGSEVLIYMPNHNTGFFEYAPNAPEDMPGLAVSAFSILDLTGDNPMDRDPGYGIFVNPLYYTTNPAEYFDFMKTQDVVNLLNVCSANHPVFVPNAAKLKAPSKYSELSSGPYIGEIKCWTEIEKERKAKDKIPNQFNFLETLCGQRAGALSASSCTITIGQPVNLCTDIEFGHFGQFYQMGEILQYSNRRYTQGAITIIEKDKPKNTGIIYRHRANMPFYSIHIYCSTVGAERHRAARLHTLNVVERFQKKNEMETRAINFLLDELGRAKSMQAEPQ